MAAIRHVNAWIRQVQTKAQSRAEQAEERWELVQEADKVVLFDDGSPEFEHFLNVANATKKPIEHFREV